jgi:transglutaminase-like putative cysteine protease
MSVKVAIEHRTTYRFDRPISIGPHLIRLRPAPHTRTPIESYALHISPSEHFVNWQQDPFGNHLARVVFPSKAAELDITVGLVADLGVINPFDFFVESYAERFPFQYPPELAAQLRPYLETEAVQGPVLDEWLAALPDVRAEGQPTVSFLSSLNSAVNRDIAYSLRMEAGVHTPDQTLTARIGSCRDSGWLLVAALRHLGLAARFVSGYLVQLAPDEVPLDGPAGALSNPGGTPP